MIYWDEYEGQSVLCKDSSGLHTSRAFVYEGIPYIAKMRLGEKTEIMPLYDLIRWEVTRVDPRPRSAVETGVLEALVSGEDTFTVTLQLDKKTMKQPI